MIDYSELEKVIAEYKPYFLEHFKKDEEYKWQAVQWFQNHWDINAPNFGEMFKIATDKCYNLLASAHRFPKAMIEELAANTEPENVRNMFVVLFDESRSLSERVNYFMGEALKEAEKSLANFKGPVEALFLFFVSSSINLFYSFSAGFSTSTLSTSFVESLKPWAFKPRSM